MSTTTEKQTITLTATEQQSAADFISAMGGDPSDIIADFTTADGLPVPPEITSIFRKVLQCVEKGTPISITTLPEEVTTTTAASMLGISRPTLMKHVRDDRIPAHKVGSHHRLFSRDVLAFQEELKNERRKAVFGLMDLESELADQER